MPKRCNTILCTTCEKERKTKRESAENWSVDRNMGAVKTQ